MKISIIKKYKGLTPFETPDLPDFVILTGKNGSGKSQFLELLNIKLLNFKRASGDKQQFL